MLLSDLPLGWVRAIAFALYLICVAALFCMVRAFKYRAAKRIVGFSFLAALLSFLPASVFALNFICIMRKLDVLSTMKLLLSLPLWAAALFICLLLTAVIVMHLRLNRLSRRTLSARSVCEGLDQLPDGVTYSLPDGFPKLVNNQMQSITNAAFGVGVMDTVQLDERLRKRDMLPGCTVDEDANNTFLRLPNGETWHLKRRQIAVENKPVTEMIAFDVTERYRDICELRQRNERLAQVNRQMRSYLDNMERIVREREVLSAKTRLHNDLGQSLLAIEAYLANPGGDRTALVQRLTNSIMLLQRDTPDERTGDRMAALLDAAAAVGVEIHMEGEMPQNWKELIEIAIHECLTNTVKHADGSHLFVRLRTTEHKVIAELTNDGKPPAGPVRETGGLANLRALTERQGGEMEIESAPAFRLVLRLNKEGKLLYGLEGI